MLRAALAILAVTVAVAPPRVVATIHVGGQPTWLALGAGSIWVANYGAGTVDRIDPRSNRITAHIKTFLALEINRVVDTALLCFIAPYIVLLKYRERVNLLIEAQEISANAKLLRFNAFSIS